MTFAYTPTAKTYELRNQRLNLHSNEKDIEAVIVFDKDLWDIQMDGMVNEATISGMNLFPSFLGWFRDNIYLAPVTLISTVFGGVAMMWNRKKK